MQKIIVEVKAHTLYQFTQQEKMSLSRALTLDTCGWEGRMKTQRGFGGGQMVVTSHLKTGQAESLIILEMSIVFIQILVIINNGMTTNVRTS